jgi:hypothetical protein
VVIFLALFPASATLAIDAISLDIGAVSFGSVRCTSSLILTTVVSDPFQTAAGGRHMRHQPLASGEMQLQTASWEISSPHINRIASPRMPIAAKKGFSGAKVGGVSVRERLAIISEHSRNSKDEFSRSGSISEIPIKIWLGFQRLWGVGLH